MEFAAASAASLPSAVHPLARHFSRFLLSHPALYSWLTSDADEASLARARPEKLRPFVERGLELMWPPVPQEERLFDRVELHPPSLPGGSIAVYRPRGAAGDALLPCLVHAHQGGFFYGGVGSAAGEASFIERTFKCLPAAGLPCVIVDVEYRFPPQATFPAAVHDCWAALAWVRANAPMLRIDAGRMAVCGESTGGNLAAALAVMDRDRRRPDVPPLRMQLLMMPLLQHLPREGELGETARAFGQRHGLALPFIDWCSRNYMAGEASAAAAAARDPLASPLLVPSTDGLAPAVLVAAERDPLRYQAERFAERMPPGAARLVVVPGTVHHTMLAVPELLHEHICRAVREHLHARRANL